METLTIVIPALNEEDAIGSTIERCLAARPIICREANLAEVEIIVVSDGSTDRTAEIAKGYEEVEVCVFPKNRGYGAAIKEGFRQGKGSLVGFLDADGTCDPCFFADLCQQLRMGTVEIALGSRLGPDSKMPRVRRIGNRIYALILGALCGQTVTDTASGMRVIRRSALADLYPLPDKLHFTPAMSARALLNGIQIAELPMPYAERVGQSKLRVLSDGVQFLKTIFEGVLWYRPERLFLAAFSCCFFASLLLAAYPTEFYFRHRHLEEWMIYRFIVCYLLGASGFILLGAGALSHRFVLSTNDRRSIPRFWPSLFERLFVGRALAVFICVATLVSMYLIWPGVVEYFSTRRITLHWSRVMTAAFGLLVAFIAFVTGALLEVIGIRSRLGRPSVESPAMAGPSVIERLEPSPSAAHSLAAVHD